MRRWLFVGSLLLADMVPGARAQRTPTTDERLTFEVASVKQNPDTVASPTFELSPTGRLAVTAYPLFQLIRIAYVSNAIETEQQIVGGPSWLKSDRFDFVAKATGSLEADETGRPTRLLAMLRALLEDRFHLRVHTESREAPVYLLVLGNKDGKPGPQLHQSPQDCRGPVGNLIPPNSSRWCGWRGGGTGHYTIQGLTMADFATGVAGTWTVGRPVLDRTGLAGRWDAQIDFVPTFVPGPNADAAPVPNPNAGDGPDMLSAMRDQLGLKLEGGRAKIERATGHDMRHLLALVLLVTLSPESQRQDTTTPSAGTVKVTRQMKPGPWTEYVATTRNRDVRFYLAHDDRTKPLVVFLRGSGCAPLFVINDDGTSSDTSIFQDIVTPRLDRFHFAMIENPGIEPLRFAPGLSREAKSAAFARSETACSDTFRINQTKGARVDDVLTVLKAVSGQPWVRRVLIIGHSEGSQVASGVIRQAPKRLNAVALFSSAGPTQFFGIHLSRGANRETLVKTFDDMRILQNAADDTVHLGEPARRWKSYALDSTPLEDVRDSTTPLYVAHGGRESNVLSADLFALEALRQQPHRPLRYVVVDGGDHALEVNGHSKILELFDDFVSWASIPNRPTDARLLK